jgi:UDP-N-acetylglucosamine 2-epimerase (non-hydrolysing)
MIYIIIGTKAQYIKMLPVMKELEKNDLSFRLIDTGQHPSITKEIRNTFDLRNPDLYLHENQKNIGNAITAFFWNLKILILGFWHCRKIIHRGDYCLVHGDTLSTLQGALIARMCRAKLVHVEAGERTHNLWLPFPEEIIRKIVDRISHVCFASSDNSYSNLVNEKISARLINVQQNTIFDTVLLARNMACETGITGKYVLVSIHRAETVYSKKRMSVIVEAVLEIAQKIPVIWGLHELTRSKLIKFGLFEQLESAENVTLRGLFDYISFIKVMQGARFLMTDGGGPQEESFLLNVPCLLMRTETERTYYQNIFLSEFNRDKIRKFLGEYSRYRCGENFHFESPSAKIIDFLAQFEH